MQLAVFFLRPDIWLSLSGIIYTFILAFSSFANLFYGIMTLHSCGILVSALQMQRQDLTNILLFSSYIQRATIFHQQHTWLCLHWITWCKPGTLITHKRELMKHTLVLTLGAYEFLLKGIITGRGSKYIQVSSNLTVEIWSKHVSQDKDCKVCKTKTLTGSYHSIKPRQFWLPHFSRSLASEYELFFKEIGKKTYTSDLQSDLLDRDYCCRCHEKNYCLLEGWQERLIWPNYIYLWARLPFKSVESKWHFLCAIHLTCLKYLFNILENLPSLTIKGTKVR